ncbi:DAK2 domain-containing protein [Nesterenkonia sp. E16_7]|uniref:DAK2 domain-containing protein n=1 Tax=unclassified Nesterenkonia TaxID=2629769 RepID=UPI001A91DC3C|nr:MULTISPECIES: DAK2 domain-containing protein [unclassified Nesterenkonia]MBO0594451.1 DAK2 domain-containing protein [Nesterenkonia sp. E16_10]MBO0598839.1 DAK2 domain-containing protein [Nesterenkonia sp. E16_7]
MSMQHRDERSSRPPLRPQPDHARAGSSARGKVKGAAAVHRWFLLAESALERNVEQLNRLNVFPIPDSDTGENMLATIRACRASVEASSTQDLGELFAAAGSRAMSEAYGNSGTLLAVLISGLAEPLHGQQRLTISGFSHALERAKVRSWSALTDPVAGTMLSVLDAVHSEVHHRALQAEEPESRAALEAAMPYVVSRAFLAVQATREQLPALQRANVVDSGGAGLLVVLIALHSTITGIAMDFAPLQSLPGWQQPPEGERTGDHRLRHRDAADQQPGGQQSGPDAGSSAERLTGTPALDGAEVMCTVRLDPLGAASLRHQLDDLGDSVIVTPIDANPDAEGTYRWRIHVHTLEEPRTSTTVHAAGPVESYAATALHRSPAAPPARDQE